MALEIPTTLEAAQRILERIAPTMGARDAIATATAFGIVWGFPPEVALERAEATFR